MDTASPAVAPSLTGALPSSTFSAQTVNEILSLFIKSAVTLEEIADQARVSVPKVLQCLEEQKPFLRNMLETLELRVRLIAARTEAIAIEALNEIVLLADDKEACRKAASKLLSHFKRPPAKRRDANHQPAPAESDARQTTCDPDPFAPAASATPPAVPEPLPRATSEPRSSPSGLPGAARSGDAGRLIIL